MKKEDLDLLARMLEGQPDLLEMDETPVLTPSKIEGSPNMTNKVKKFDNSIDDIANALDSKAIETTAESKDLAKKYLAEARTRASMIEANPKMYKELGKEALGKAKDVLKKPLKEAAKGGLKMLPAIAGGLPGLMLSGAAEAFDAESAGPMSGSDEDMIQNPSLPLEVRQQAMKRVKNKYLKPKEDQDE